MNYELTKLSTMELKNSELKGNLIVMVEAEKAAENGAWAFAKALTDIIKGEQYKTDFEKKGKFAKAVNISAGRLSQCVGAVDFIEKHEQFADMTVENAYLVGSLAVKENGKRVNKTEEFISALDAKNIPVEQLTTAQLKELIKKFKEAYGKEVVDTEAQETEAQETEAQETEAQETEVHENKIPLLIGIGYVAETGQYVVKDDKGSQIVCNQPKAALKAIADYFNISIEMIDDNDLTEMEKALKLKEDEEKPKTRKGAKARK
jgi:nitrate reductase NapAB chaperone NapD